MSLVATVIPLAAGVAAAQVTCFGQPATVQLALGQVPTTGNDVIVGTPGDDVIAASDGDDLVCGLGGNDSIWGQNGHDALDGGDGDDRLRGGSGDDVLRGRAGVDDLAGGSGVDDVDGGSGPDAKVRGGTGDDMVNGGSGNDVLVTGNGGRDEVTGGPGNDELVTGGPRPDVVRGGDGNDLVKGNKGADLLFGDAGDDDLRGGPQPDTLDGGAGTDVCSGGTTGEGAPESDSARNCESYSTVESVEAGVAVGSFVLTAVDTGQVLAPDGVGPDVMLASIDGSAAVWATSENDDGSISLLNVLTGKWLAVQEGAVVLVADAAARGMWQAPVVGADGFVLSIDGLFLLAEGTSLGLTAIEAGATVWSLTTAPAESSASMITNVRSAFSLTGTSAEDRSIVRVGPGEGLARGYWTIDDVAASTEPCSPVGGVTRCVVIRNNELGEVLDADRSNGATPVKTTSLVGEDSLWEIDELGDGSFTLKNVERGEFLTQNGPRSVNTQLLGTADGLWTTASVALDASGCPETDAVVAITSHADGDVVDVSMEGSGTGSFMLSGTAPVGTQSVNVTLGGMATGANLDIGACSVSWSVEASPPTDGASVFTIDALQGSTVVASASISLMAVTASIEEPLLTPEAAAAPDLEPLLISYDPVTGTMVFSGEVADELRIDDVLASEPSDLAPDGYLRAVVSVSFDGTNTIVITRQAALTEFVRQLNVVYQGALEDNPTFDVTAPLDPAVDGTIAEAGPDGAVISVGNSSARNSRQADFNPEGALDFSIDPDLDLDIDIDWERNCWYCLPLPKLKRFLAEASVAMDVKASIQINRAGGLDTGLRYFGPELDDYKLGVITLPTPIPIVITIELDMQAFYTASLNAAFKAEFVWSAEAKAGYEYRDEGGRGAYRDLVFPDTPVPSYDFDLGLIGSIAFGVEVELGAKLYGSAGVEFQVRPRIEAEVTADLIDREIKFEGKFKMPISSGIEIDLIVKELEFGEIEFINLEYPLWSISWTVPEDEEEVAEVMIVDPEWGEVSARSLFGHVFEATGEGPFEWEAIRLPDGFVFSPEGVLRGIPGTAGSYTFEIRVTAANGSTTSNQFVLRVVETEVGSGRLQFTLRWDNDNDMDLHIYEPDGTHIWYNDPGPMASGGQLDRDDNVNMCGTDPVPGGVENVFWPSETGAPLGVYRIDIVEFRRCDGQAESSWTLEAFSESALVLSRSGVGAAELSFSYFGPSLPLAG